MSESMSAENYEQSLSVFAVYGVSSFSNHSYKNDNYSYTTDFNYDLITVNSTEEEINSFYFYRVEEDRITCTLIPGDGVGPDLVKSVRQVFEAASIPIDFETYHLSEVDTLGSATLDEVARSIRKNRIALKGILAYPGKGQATELETMNMKLRKRLDLFANVVHIQSLAGIQCRHSNINIDTIIIREQTEGEYTALEHESVKGVVECLKIVTAVKSRKIAKFAFDYATYLNRKKVTAVHKANIMKLGDGLFLKSCDEMARLYPKLKYEKMIIDNCTMQFVSRPQQFDVLLTPNLYGNIIDNLAAGLVGGAGLVAGSSYSQDCVVFEPTEQFTILWILFVMIVLGNSAVLLTLSLNKRRKSRMNFFIKQLAIADLTVGLLSVLTDIIWRMTVAWYAGNIACKLIRFLQATVTYSSTYVLVALSIDRYDAITHPMNFTGSWRRARILVISAWMISFLFSIPEIYLFEEKPIEGQLQCWIELQPWQWRVYMTLITIALLVVPAIIISACYTVIVRTIWSKSKLLVAPPINEYQLSSSNSRRRQSSTSNRTVVYRYEDHDTRRASSRGIIPKAKIKTVKMTFVIVFVFVLCWSPYIVFNLLQVYGQIPRTQTTTAIATLIQSLVPLNSAANPLIYCLFSTRTCRTLRKLFPLKWLSGCPGFEAGSSHCLGGSDTSSRTVTTSLTQHSSRRSTSANQQHTIRIQSNNPSVNSRHCKVAISVV